MANDGSRGTTRQEAYPPPPPPLWEGAGLEDLKDEPPTRPPDLAAKASSGEVALIMRAAATAAATGKPKGLIRESD